jgi:SMP-30/Gluconolactonase/LRE-like region
LAGLLMAICAVSLAGEVAPRLTAGPTVKREGGSTRISFSVSVATDVEVAILDAGGKVIRHLVAGLLGPKAPAPLKKDSLVQEVVWDGKDDRGQKAAGAAKVRLRVGLKAELDRYLGWNGLTLEQEIVGIAVDAKGDIYVASTERSWGRTLLTVISREGKYKRTAIPFSAKTPLARRKAFGVHKMPDGTEVPFVFNGHSGMTQFMVSALRDQDLVVHPAGHLVLTSANGSLSNHGPAQHLLAVHPEGGAPEKVAYVGPRVRKPVGFLGGAGNRDADMFNGLAVSPDGKYFYQARHTNHYRHKRDLAQCVYRLEWSDKSVGEPFLGKKQAGADDAHFNRIAGLATDSKGNIYVCDYGNKRLMVFSPEGKLLKKLEVANPYQVKVHPKSGVVYVLGRQITKRLKVKNSAITKYSSLADGMKKVAEHNSGKRLLKMALDPTASPPRLIVALYGGWWRHDKLCVMTDKGATLELGEQINNRRGVSYPLFGAVDRARNKYYVNSFMTGLDSIDLRSGKVSPLKLDHKNSRLEVTVRDNGDIYAASGWAWKMSRFGDKGKHLPLKDGGEKGWIGPWKMGQAGKRKLLARMKGRGQGGRGFAFGPDGNLYIIKMSQYSIGWVDVYSPEGKLLKEKVIDGIPHGSGGIGVDAAGNIYIGGNLRPATGTDFYPKGFEKAPTGKWVWYRGKKRPEPWNHLYFNTYLFHSGGIMKFPPTGGKFYTWRPGGRKPQPKPAGMPEGLPTYRSGYLSLNIAVKGMEWYVKGCSAVPTSGENWGDPSCTCWNVRINVDPYGRVFAPDTLRFCVGILDTAGNVITRVGRHGNADDGRRAADSGAKSAVYLAWPAFVDVAGDKLYITDTNANRVAVVKLEYAAEASAGL